MTRTVGLISRWTVSVALLVLVIGLLWPTIGRATRCGSWSRDWAWIFIGVSPDGNVWVRSVHSEFEETAAGLSPFEDPTRADEIEWQLFNECTTTLRLVDTIEAHGSFAIWRWTQRVPLPEHELESVGVSAAAARQQVLKFIATSDPGRSDIVALTNPRRDFELLLAALADPDGFAVRYDFLALLREIVSWLVCAAFAISSLWGIVRLRRCAAQVLRVERGNNCWSCGYSREGLPPEAICPECGNEASLSREPEEIVAPDQTLLTGPRKQRIEGWM